MAEKKEDLEKLFEKLEAVLTDLEGEDVKMCIRDRGGKRINGR